MKHLYCVLILLQLQNSSLYAQSEVRISSDAIDVWGDRIFSTRDAGIRSYSNFIGFHARNNSTDGFYSSANLGSGYMTLKNVGDGLRALDNDGYAAYLTSPTSRIGAAVYISHQGDKKDLEFGGHARIKAEGSYALTLGGTGQSFQVRDPAENIVFRVIDNGYIKVGAPGFAARFFSDGSYVFNLDQGNIATNSNFQIRNSAGDQIVTFYETSNTVFSVWVDAVGFNSTSDRRYKKDITQLHSSLTNLNRVRGVRYLWDQEAYPEKSFSEEPQIGFIAQELEQVYPELVHTDEDGYKSVAYSKMTAILVEAVKELKVENEELRLENKKLKQFINGIEARVSSLESLK